MLLVRFEDHDDRDAAETLRGTVLTIPGGNRRPLADDEYWPDELVGLEAVDEEGGPLGRVSAVIEGPAQFRLVVDRETGSAVEVPFVEALVPDVDLAGRRVTIRAIPGLMDPRSATDRSDPRG